MKKNNYLILCVLFLLGTTLACNLFAGDEPSGADQPGLPPDVLFKDDFSDPSSGWDQVDSSDGMTDYENGYYRILVNSEDTDVWANPGLHFTNVVVEVDATKAGGSDDNDFGVICRYQDVNNFYFFIISSDGYYGVGKIVDGEQSIIGTDQLYPDDSIRQGNTTNHLKADCVGSHLVLHVNGTKITDVEDDTFSDGDVGLLAGTFSEPGTDIHFDNFVVKKP